VRRLFWLAVAAGLAVWVALRRRPERGPQVTIGYADGSAVTLDPGAPELDRLVQLARDVAA
jgi:hypothetical protein